MVIRVNRLFAFLSIVLSAGCNNGGSNNGTVKDSASASFDSGKVTSVPLWIKQSNIYEVNIRQYSSEGTFKAFESALPRLKEMGMEILWFMPVTPISKIDRKGTLGSYYAVQDYKAINPEFGTMQDWKRLVEKAHSLGFKVIMDWVANHTGADNRWLTDHPDFYTRDSSGKAMAAFDWTDTRDLNFDNREMRDSMIAAMEFWLKESPLDGFRCDVAGEVPDDFWKECIGRLRRINPAIFMLAEGDKGSLHRAGFNASYPWEMFQAMKKVAAGKATGRLLDSVLARQDSTFPAGAIRMYFTSNHDENSWNKSDYGTFPGVVHAPFAVFTQTMAGSLPLIYSGQEEPLLRKLEFFEKDNINFAKYRRAPFYRALLGLRKRNAALSTDAQFRRVQAGDPEAIYAYVRQKDSARVLVILNLSTKEQKVQVDDPALTGNPMNLFLGVKEPVGNGHSFNIEPWGYVVYEYGEQ